ncbi:unnamed protein product [Caenorhabditis auriculariae]|uniref:C2H2-type domain-containing protein n=1 Tax=Caenorhabditis auriculariae TaxID=2777116 RepID=A0A8S1HPE8_9PELO|nr:unnamed protein product [Caenorhabditis auriculariae]
MFSSELFADSDISTSVIPFYEIEHGVSECDEEVVSCSPGCSNHSRNFKFLAGKEKRQFLNVRIVEKREREKKEDKKRWEAQKVQINSESRCATSIAWVQINRSDEVEKVVDQLELSHSLKDCDPPLASATQPEWYNNSHKRFEEDCNGETATQKMVKAVSLHVRTFKIPVTTSSERANDAVFVCGVAGCDAVLKSSTALRKHGKVHAKKTFTCEQCKMSFVEKTKLRRHMKVHSGEKPFKCTFASCAASFSNSSNLKAHAKTHTGDKPHKCKFCPRAFLHPYNLKVHTMRLHAKNR